MSRYPLAWEKDILWVAIDPAQLKSGIAYRGVDLKGEVVKGVFSISDIRYILGAGDRLLEASGRLVFKKVLLTVEYPKWNAGASQVVRSAAEVWVRLIKDLYPGKVEVRKVDPNVWQASFNFRNRAANLSTKDYSFWLATNAYGWEEVATSDEADAAMILEYSRTIPPTPRKPRSKKISRKK